MAKQVDKLTLHKLYRFDQIESLAREYDLMEKMNGFLKPLSDGGVWGEIGEIVMPLYFDSGELAANFILTGYGMQGVWRCIYVCAFLSSSNKHAI